MFFVSGRYKRYFVILFLFLLIVGVYIYTRNEPRSAPVQQFTRTEPAINDKFNTGVNEFYITYEQVSIEKAFEVADKYNMDPEDGRVNVHLTTKELSPHRYRQILEKMGATGINSSDSTRFISVYVTFDQLQQLAVEDWVVAIDSPGSTLPSE